MKILEKTLGIIERISAYFSGLFKKKVPAPKPRKRKPGAAKANWVDGDYATIKTLLDDLEHRYGWLAGYRPKRNETGMRLMKKLGVYMIAPVDHATFNIDSLDGGPSRKYPAAMAAAFSQVSINDDDEVIDASNILLWAQKHKWNQKHYNVSRPQNGWFYEFGLLIYHDNTYSSHSIALEIVDGEISLLRVKQSETVNIPNSKTCSHYTRVNWQKQDLGPTIAMERAGDTSKEANERHAIEEFRLLYNAHLRRDASTQVHATKGNVRMVFTVPAHSWKDFFKDRDITALASDGKRKRIFHHVSAHERANGQKVKMHTRGLTRFKWGRGAEAFNIRILEQKPGRLAFVDFDIAPEVKDEVPGERRVSVDEVGARVTGIMTEDLHRPSA